MAPATTPSLPLLIEADDTGPQPWKANPVPPALNH
jgi:hypothetical protein